MLVTGVPSTQTQQIKSPQSVKMYTYSTPLIRRPIPSTETKLSVTKIPVKNDSDWLYFIVPIIVTVVIFMLVIIWICIKKRDDESWNETLKCSKHEELPKKEKTVSFHEESCKIYVTNEDESPPNSPDKRESSTTNWLTERTRRSCPPMSKLALQNAKKKYGEENALINQEPYYTNVDNPMNPGRKNKRAFRSENDLEFLRVTPGTSVEKFRLSFEQMNMNSDVVKEKFASYVILEGSEYKNPSSVPKYDPPTTRPPSIPSRLSRGSFIEIHMSDLHVQDTPVAPYRERLLSDSSDLTDIVYNDNDAFPIHKELPKSPTHLNSCSDESFPIYRELPEPPIDVSNPNSNEGSPSPIHNEHSKSPTNIKYIHNDGMIYPEPSRVINTNDSIPFPANKQLLNSPKDRPVVNGNGSRVFPADKKLPKIPDEHAAVGSRNGLPFSKHRPLTKSTSEPPLRINIGNDKPFLMHENHNSSFKQRELPPTPTGIPDIYINDEERSYVDTGVQNNHSNYESLAPFESKPYLQLLPNGKDNGS